MTEAEAIEAARHFIWYRTESYPVYPLDDEGDIDLKAVSDGNYDWNILEAFEITSAELTETILDEDCYTVRVEGSWSWSELGGDENFGFEVYVPKDAPLDTDYFDHDRVE